MNFLAECAKLLAESVFLLASGQGEGAFEAMHERILLQLLIGAKETLAAFHLDESGPLDEAFRAAGDAFHARYKELASAGKGGSA